MKKMRYKSLIAVILAFAMLSSMSVGAFAGTETSVSAQSGISEKVEDGWDYAKTAAFKALISVLEKNVTNKILSVFNKLCPSDNIVTEEEYYETDSENFFEGGEAEGDGWKVGFGAKSFFENVEEAFWADNEFYFGGYFSCKLNDFSLSEDVDVDEETKDKMMSPTYDDQGVNAVALSPDGEKVLFFAAIDGIGVNNKDIRAIRAKVVEELDLDEEDVLGINVNGTHAHTGIDTQGMSLDLLFEGKILRNIIAKQLGKEEWLIRSINNDFQEQMINQTVAALVDAYNGMEDGDLDYFETEDLSDRSGLGYLYNKRYGTDSTYQEEFACFLFTPDDGSDATIVANLGMHPTKIGRDSGKISGDVPNYIEMALNDLCAADDIEGNEYNFMFMQGAQAPVSVRGSDAITERGENAQNVKKEWLESKIQYGTELDGEGNILYDENGNIDYGKRTWQTNKLVGESGKINEGEYNEAKSIGYDLAVLIKEAAEGSSKTPVAAKINANMKEVTIPVDYGILYLGVITELFGANAVKCKNSVTGLGVVTEVGYIEIGNDLAMLLMPGEIMPELIFGDDEGNSVILDGKETWTEGNWDYNPLETSIRTLTGDADKKVIVMGLANDALGYVVPDNDAAPWFVDFIWELKIEVNGVDTDSEWVSKYMDGDKFLLGTMLFGTYRPHYEELLTVGSKAASSIVGGIEDILKNEYAN